MRFPRNETLRLQQSITLAFARPSFPRRRGYRLAGVTAPSQSVARPDTRLRGNDDVRGREASA